MKKLILLLLVASAFAVDPPLKNVNPLTNPAGTANLWIDSNGGTCTRQSTPGAWVDAQGCSSMQAAQNAASAGDIVVMKNGTYSEANCSLTSGAKASFVTYFAETREQVLCTSHLVIYIDKVRVSGIIMAGTGNSRGALDLDYDSGTGDVIDGFRGSSSWVSAPNPTIMNSEFGNFNACDYARADGNTGREDGIRLWAWGPSSNQPVKVQFLYNIVHDLTSLTGGNPDIGCSGMDAHSDCVQLLTGADADSHFKGNTFFNCSTSDIQLGWGTFNGTVFEDNYFGPPLYGGNGLTFGQTGLCTITFRNNVYNYANINPSGCGDFGGGTGTWNISGNIFMEPFDGVTNGTISGANNVFPATGTTVGTSVKRCTPTWLNGTPSDANGWDIRLSTSDTCAKDSGNPANYSTTDMYGNSRPQGSGPDAGAFEVGGIAPPTTVHAVSGGNKLSGGVSIH